VTEVNKIGRERERGKLIQRKAAGWQEWSIEVKTHEKE
jgi:hypothetical protein